MILIHPPKQSPPDTSWPVGYERRVLCGDAALFEDSFVDQLIETRLILLTSDTDDDWITEFAEKLRAHGVDTPIGALGRAAPLCAAIDQWIPSPASAVDIASLASRWNDAGLTAVFDGLYTRWGEAMDGVVDGFIERLRKLLATLTSPDVDERHQLCGLAGTLGFAALSGAAQGGSAAAVRHESRRALSSLVCRRRGLSSGVVG